VVILFGLANNKIFFKLKNAEKWYKNSTLFFNI